MSEKVQAALVAEMRVFRIIDSIKLSASVKTFVVLYHKNEVGEQRSRRIEQAREMYLVV